MPFSFLNPWLWLGAAAVAAPIWLHLRRKREKHLLRFSALRFLADQPTPQRSPLHLRDYLLFAVRILALLLLVAAFAWPYLRSANTVPIHESRVYILDNTLSRQANDGWKRDRDYLVHELAAAGPELQVAVVELTASPQVVVAFGDDRQSARQKLQALGPSFQRGSYLAAFRQADALLGNSLGLHKRIILLSDNQENQWTENVSTPPFLRDIQVDLPRPAAGQLPNVALSEPRAQRIFLGDKSLVHFTVKLSHSGPAASAQIILKANNQVVFNKAVELEKQPEAILLQAQWEADPRSWLQGEAEVQANPDSLPADNRVFFSLAPVTEGKLALLAQSPYLRLALSPDVMRGQWATRALDPAQLGAEVRAKPEAEVLCLESSFLQGPEARHLLLHYLSAGRGVLLVVNRLTPTIDGFLHELGFDADGVVDARQAPEKFQFVFSNHPIFHPFLAPDYGNLMEIKVSRYARLRAADAMPLIFGEKGAPLFFQSTKYSGRLFVAAFGLDREQSSWPIHQTFIPFLDLTLQAARAADPTPTSFEPGELGIVQVSGPAIVKEVSLRQGHRELARAPVEQGRAQLRLPPEPGLYAVTYDERPEVQKLLSVNPSPKESQLSFVQTPRALTSWQVERPAEPTPPALLPAPGKVRMAGVLQQRLWWWMLLGAVLTLLLEMSLAERRREGA